MLNQNIKQQMINGLSKSGDQVHEYVKSKIDAMDDSIARTHINGALDSTMDLAILMHSTDRAGQNSVVANGAVMQLKSISEDKVDTAVAELEKVQSDFNDVLEVFDGLSDRDELKPLALLGARPIRSLSHFLNDTIEVLKKGDGTLSEIQFSAVDSAQLSKIPASAKAILNQYFYTDYVTDELTFADGQVSTALSTDFVGSQGGAQTKIINLPLHYIQNYYKLLTFLVTTPIVMRPTPWTTDLVNRMVVSSEVVRESGNIKLIELDDNLVPIEQGEPDINRSVSILSKLKNFTTENTQSESLTTHTMQISISEFRKPVERLNFERVLSLTYHRFQLEMERIIREFVLGAINEPAIVASGDTNIAEGGQNAIPGVLALSGVDQSGVANQTINEVDLRKILDGLNMHVGGTMITHALIHPKALLTICDTFREVGYWPRSIDSNAGLLTQPLNAIDPGKYTTGAGVGSPELSQRAPGLFGPNITSGSYSPGMGESITDIINHLSPSTSSFNLESSFYHKFVIKVGNIELSIVPNVDAVLYKKDSGGTFNDVTNAAYELPMFAVTGDVYTDILLINAHRTCMYLTTGIMVKSMVSSGNWMGESMNVVFHEDYRLILNNKVEAFKIDKVRIESDYSHRAIVVRK